MAMASTGPPRLDHGVTPVLSREHPSASQQHPANLIRLDHFAKSAGSPSNSAKVPSAATRTGRPAAEPRCSSSAKSHSRKHPYDAVGGTPSRAPARPLAPHQVPTPRPVARRCGVAAE
ncbi:hypothetical protein JIQ42_01402 [Leishmania sp. Namibia]|uniref:hypothetical protein n=1 Tax=Leishmania sp. Namibia TaxID=2802991 RepID=UPI001B6EEB19|nr:hypothetical protein JIQ42_01402 [Leishmania sp. Namibia]